MKIGLPVTLFTLPLSWAVLVWAVPNTVKRLDVKGVGYQLGRMGRVQGSEREILITMAVAIVLWVGGGPLSMKLGMSSDLLSAAVVALGAAAVLFIRGVIDWEDVHGVSWGVIFVIGSGLCLSDALAMSGAGDWLASLLEPMVSGQPYFVSILTLTAAAAVLTNLMNNTTISATFVPILILTAIKTGVDLGPLALAMPVALSANYGYALPSASGRCALLAATGIITRREMLKYGVMLAIPSLLALVLYFTFLEAVGLLGAGPL
jgi:sodium-dependent dicarboxylate transporter 2/3/5